LAVTDWRLRRWRLWILALMTATRKSQSQNISGNLAFSNFQCAEFGSGRGVGELAGGMAQRGVRRGVNAVEVLACCD